MKFKFPHVGFILLSASVVLFAFEQALYVFWGSESIFKPYRLALIGGLLLTVIFPARLVPEVRKISLYFAAIYLLGVLLALFWSMYTDVDLDYVVHQLLLLAFGYTMYILVLVNVRTEKDLNGLLWVIVVSAILSTGVWFVLNPGHEFYRATGFFRNPNHFAYMLVLAIVISIYFILQNSGCWLLTVFLIMNAIGLVAILFISGSRTSLITLFPVLVFMVYKNIASSGRGLIGRLFIGLLMVIILSGVASYMLSGAVLSDRQLARYESDNISTASGRTDLWRAGMLAVSDYGGLGMGIGQYVHNHAYYIQQIPGGVYQTLLEYDLGLHSELVTLLTEFGVIGLFGYLFIIYRIWSGTRRLAMISQRHKPDADLAGGLIAFNVIFSLSQDMYGFPYNWLVLGICVATINLSFLGRMSANLSYKVARS